MSEAVEFPYCFDPGSLVPGRLLPGYGVVGERPETYTLGFRWTAADNMFTNAGLIAIEEWKKLNAAVDEQSDERKLRQFVWALPIEDTQESTLTISASAVRRRMGVYGRGIVPADWGFAGFLDLGQRVCHWSVVAGADRYGVVDTGVVEVPQGDRTVEDGIRLALWQWYDRVILGWTGSARLQGPAATVASEGGGDGRPAGGSATGDRGEESGVWSPESGGKAPFGRENGGLESPRSMGGSATGNRELESPRSMGGNVLPGIVGVDSGKWSTVVYEFIREVSKLNSGVMWFATKGHGLSQDQGRVYTMPEKRTEAVRYIGDRYHLRLQEEHRIYLMHMDSDAWKSRVHASLTTEMGEPGSLVLWNGGQEDTDVWTLSKHLTAEKGIEEFDPKRGMVKRWVRTNRNNHLLDCVYGCLVGLDYLRVVEDATEAARQSRAQQQTSTGGGAGASGPFRWEKD